MRRTHAAHGLLAILVLLVAACLPAQPDGGAEAGRPGEEGELAHAQCMRDHGIDWPDPEYIDGEWQVRPGDDVDLESPAYEEAEAECARLQHDAQPDAGDDSNPEDRVQLEAQMDKMLEFAACMRDQGIEFPDPVMDDSGTISGPAGPMDGDWEAFEAAKRTCEDQTGEPMP